MPLFRTYVATAMFLGSYFVLTVLGNLIFFSPIGDEVGENAVAGFSIRHFQTAGSLTYWVLLLLPFAIVPPAVFLARRIFSPMAAIVVRLPTLSKVEYLAALAICYLYVAISLWRANAVGLMLRGADFAGAIDGRFALAAALGFWPLMVLKSVLVALSCYGFVRAIITRDPFWAALAIFNFIAMSIALLLLNMKWPLIAFYLVHLGPILLLANRKLVPSIALCLLAGASYIAVSLLLVRAIPTPVIAPPPAGQWQAAPTAKMPSTAHEPARSGQLGEKTGAAPPVQPEPRPRSPGKAFASAALDVVNRMAQPFPYYVETFATNAGKCGTLLTRILRKPSPCQPSNLIYAEMFSDNFAGLGTAPQAPHVTGFALDGWSGAIIELVATSIVLGLFAAAAGSSTPEQATLTVLGALAGYHFSQLPFEGPLVYDHGIIWWLLPMLVLAAARATGSKMIA